MTAGIVAACRIVQRSAPWVSDCFHAVTAVSQRDSHKIAKQNIVTSFVMVAIFYGDSAIFPGCRKAGFGTVASAGLVTSVVAFLDVAGYVSLLGCKY
ncbi:hypothetical protein [Mesorhizobium sp. LNJC403B00]|uniref:hypothetical protein n=2 Tax=unclassified Mesorhizobium TaxID=325217 RepID=UPI0012EB59FD|nr:hypothetical protein [Mesorhizobium sp. LNJC403B00]